MSSEGPNDLGERIAKAKAAREEREGRKRRDDQADGSNLSAGAYALRFGIEFAVSILVGGALGWLVDYFAGTKPWGLLIGGAFGIAAGVRAVMRAYKELNARAQELAQGQGAPKKEDGTEDE
ncbi:AtpZ/AtpI family protein [uncultured Hyphomonas sp.]|uniref:AtpZ/AtpI family protein n=1 Tax=uncultured Hyphomonas sp. TaxID=225298 RepID=UPI002AAA9D75|nr:AtpZ/AtpI family protein [uncultured Hyphomonas sp.]